MKLVSAVLYFSFSLAVQLDGKDSASWTSAPLSSTLLVAMTQQTPCIPKVFLPGSNASEHR